MTLPDSDVASSSSAFHLPLRVRAARLDDLSQLAEVLVNSFYPAIGWTRWVHPVIKLGILEDLKQRLRFPKPGYVCLAAIHLDDPATRGVNLHGRVVGTVELSRRQSFPWQPLKGTYVYLSNLAVHEAFRRQGVARKLLRTCESIAQEWGFHALHLHVMEDNLQARYLYRQVGFQISKVEETPLTWLGFQPRRLLLQKNLPTTRP